MTLHRIDRVELERRLIVAADRAIEFARTMVRDHVPERARFLVQPNQSCDATLHDDEEVFPQDSLPERQTLGPLDASEAASWLWRDGKIPAWIDVRVHDADALHAILWLTCCGRFTAMTERLYHAREGNRPFHVTSPLIPIGWESVDRSGRFDLAGSRVPPPN